MSPRSLRSRSRRKTQTPATFLEHALSCVARLAARRLETPVAAIALRNGDRIRFPAIFGMDSHDPSFAAPPTTTLLSASIIEAGVPAMLEDRRLDRTLSRASDVPPDAVACAGVPMRTEAGAVIGALWVAQPRPRAWSAGDRESLCDLAACAVDLVECGAVGRATERRMVPGTKKLGLGGIRVYEEIDPTHLRDGEQLQQILDQLPAILWSTDRDLRLVAVRGGRDGVASSLQRFRGRAIGEAFEPAAEGPAPVEAHGTALLGEGAGYRARWAGRSFDVRVQPLRRGVEIVGTLGVAIDVTGRAEAEAELARKELYFRTLIENTSDIVSVLDPHGTIRYESPSVRRVLGYRPEDLVGRNAFDLLHPDDVASATALLETIVQTLEIPSSMVVRCRHFDGSWRDLEATGSPLFEEGRLSGFVVSSRDISERKRAEARVARSRDLYLRLFDRFPALVWRTDRTGQCDYFNHSWLAFTGRTLPEEVGTCWTESVHPDDLDRVVETFSRAFASGEPFDIETRLRHHTGAFRRVYGVGQPTQGLDGEFLGYVGACFDVEDRRALEEQLRQSQKMEAIGRLAGGVAHDFNNLLHVISGNAGLALLDLPEDSPIRECLSEIDLASTRARSLTGQLLAFSRLQRAPREAIDLNGHIREMEGILGRLLRKEVEMTTKLDPGVGAVVADPGQLSQILVNLAVNARDAMPGGGRLVIETAGLRPEEGGARRVRGRPERGHLVRLTVRDSGCGIPAEVQARMFEPFFTTKELGLGTGLGLSIVYEIVEQSGGTIEVESEMGRGTAFHVYLPRAERPPPS